MTKSDNLVNKISIFITLAMGILISQFVMSNISSNNILNVKIEIIIPMAGTVWGLFSVG